MISEPVLIRLFCDGLRPSIHAQAKQKSCQKDTWDQTIKKIITAKAKAALNLFLWVYEIDVCCPRGYCSASKPVKDHTRNQDSLSFCPQEAQTMPLHCSKRAKTLERPRRNHQKSRHKKNCRNCGLRSSRPQGSTLATEVNTTKTLAQNDCGRD